MDHFIKMPSLWYPLWYLTTLPLLCYIVNVSCFARSSARIIKDCAVIFDGKLPLWLGKKLYWFKLYMKNLMRLWIGYFKENLDAIIASLMLRRKTILSAKISLIKVWVLSKLQSILFISKMLYVISLLSSLIILRCFTS